MSRLPKSNEGVLGFDQNSKVQRTPVLLPTLRNIVQISCGDNHALALDNKGAVFAWGSGQQNQLGRRVIERTRQNGLVPRQVDLAKKAIAQVACGAYHSFAIDKAGKVFAWGLNNFGETGIMDGAGEANAVVLKPTTVSSLSDAEVTHIDGGAHHSIAVTKDGACLVWGRMDGSQSGMTADDVATEDVIMDERGSPRILARPTQVKNVPPTVHAVCGSDHCIAITKDGKAYSWGFSASYQTGQGALEDVAEATLINNTAVSTVKLTWAGAGGQFSVLAAPAEEVVADSVNA